MQLYFQSYPEASKPEPVNSAEPPVIIIPGLFGSTSNWRSFARALSVEYRVFVVDQRNHGRSPHADTQSYDDMVEDLLDFIEFQGFDTVHLCGHSMGGKTAMCFALQHPDYVKSLSVLDIAPTRYAHSHAPFLDELINIDLSTLKSRVEADNALKQAIPETGTRLFLLQSLTGTPGAYQWRLNLPVLRDAMHDLVGFPSEKLERLSSDVKTVFIAGGNSDYVRTEHHPEILQWFPNSQFVLIEKASHWLHVDQPQAVLSALKEFIEDARKE